MRDVCQQIGVVHRTGPTSASAWGIYVRFIRKADKEAFLKARRVKRDLKIGHDDYFSNLSGSASESIVFVNEALCPERQALLKRARELKKEKKLHDAWPMGGNIYVRKTEGGDRILIRDRTVLESLIC